jgi:hypothetical protein
VVAELTSSVPCVTALLILLRRQEYPALPGQSGFHLPYSTCFPVHSSKKTALQPYPLFFFTKYIINFTFLVWGRLEESLHSKGCDTYLKIIKESNKLARRAIDVAAYDCKNVR